MAVTLRRDGVEEIGWKMAAYDWPRYHGKTARSGYISTERDGYFVVTKPDRGTHQVVSLLSKRSVGKWRLTIGLAITAKRLGRATSRRSEMATLQTARCTPLMSKLPASIDSGNAALRSSQLANCPQNLGAAIMFRKRHPEAGARPGTLVLGPDAGPVEMRVTLVHGEKHWSYTCRSTDELPSLDTAFELLWVDVRGLGDGKVLQELSHRFKISPLAMEDLVNAPQRPKSELFIHQQLIIAHSLVLDDHDDASVGQIGIVHGENYVLTFHQECDHVLAPIRDRLQNPQARLRRNGPGYLVYAILDSCVDGCYPYLERLGERIESLEQLALREPRPDLLVQIHGVKNLLARLRRSIWPQREMVLSLLNGDSSFISDGTREYLRDTADHCAQLADVVDMYRESTSGLVNTYMSAVAHRSNEIMKVLTLLTSVFVPPTFLAGIYGMNFSTMPELQYAWAYPTALLLMLAMIGGTLLYFHRRGWLSGAPIADKGLESARESAVPVSRNIVLEAEFDADKHRAA